MKTSEHGPGLSPVEVEELIGVWNASDSDRTLLGFLNLTYDQYLGLIAGTLPVPEVAGNKQTRQQLEGHILKLHDLIRRGRGDSEEADHTREAITDIRGTLPLESRTITDGLLGDLYMLTEEEVLEAGGHDTKESLNKTMSRQDWARVLELLRGKNLRAHLTEDFVAYTRGCCWLALGYTKAALTFFRRAVQLSPN